MSVADEDVGVAVIAPDCGLTCNQFPPLCSITDVVNVEAWAGAPFKVRVIGDGSEPPCNSVNAWDPAGVTDTELAEVIVRFTGIVVELLSNPGELIWIDPV